MSELINKIAEIKSLLREAFPMADGGMLFFSTYNDGGWEVTLPSLGTYEQGTEVFRQLGIGEREKMIVDGDTEQAWVCISGKLGDGTIKGFCSDLPPSCHIEKFVEKIPKRETVDSGEFIEVERTRVVCGQGVAA